VRPDRHEVVAEDGVEVVAQTRPRDASGLRDRFETDAGRRVADVGTHVIPATASYRNQSTVWSFTMPTNLVYRCGTLDV
jgi:hypothetical protein